MTDTVTSLAIANSLGFTLEPETTGADLPRVRLAQGLTPEVLEGVVQPGTWILPGGATTTELRGKVVGVRRTRALWHRDGGTATVVCRSPDGVTGVGSPGGDCADCPMAQWTDAPPACTLSYEYLLLLAESGAPVVVQMSTRSAGATIRALNMAVRAHGQVDVTLRAQLVTKGSRRYYVPTARFEWEHGDAGH